MKTRLRFDVRALLLLWFLVMSASAQAAMTAGEESVFFKNGEVQVEQQGVLRPLEEDLDLSASIKVQTNGTFTVQGGKPRHFKEGQILRKDGYLINPDGTMTPVFDRVVLEPGNVVTVYKDDQASPLRDPMKFPNKLTILPDGTMTLPDGQLSRMIEGQMVLLKGGDFIPAKDSVTLKKGVVYVQKEGAQLIVPRERTLMMNEGTKVFGTGNLVRMDGTAISLKEGEIVILQGVDKHR